MCDRTGTKASLENNYLSPLACMARHVQTMAVILKLPNITSRESEHNGVEWSDGTGRILFSSLKINFRKKIHPDANPSAFADDPSRRVLRFMSLCDNHSNHLLQVAIFEYHTHL
ncbi:hypothetical protein HNY73_005302 [Argiope bruennichi]|uniref:Uncharacterized protein n=1 Tax=Argiope bruennichi TaxID=94029 RepID=A0A8T0FIN4_ARGBR|nr:hypothetical protein HNY73_005302 [Argiope bruennichi]